MAGTSWDKLGQSEAAFEEVAGTVREVAREAGARLHEFFRDDPVWRLDLARERGGDGAVDVSWSEASPQEYAISSLWWEGESLRREAAGSFARGGPHEQLRQLLSRAVNRLPARS